MRAACLIVLVGSFSLADAQKPYALPPAIGDALAKEKLAGNVLVRSDLYPSAAAARADTKAAPRGAVAMKVVADRGDVVEVSTAPTKDCAAAWDEPYVLRAFVKREKLVPRLKAAITKTFSDGTAIAIDRGAPVAIGPAGLEWETLDVEPALPPAEDQLVLSVPALMKPAALPATPKDDRLVCNGTPQTHAEWLAETKRARDAAFKTGASLRDVYARYEEWCGVYDPGQYDLGTGASKAPLPTVDGKPIPWPFMKWNAANENVVRSGNTFLGDVHYTCGRVRMAVVGAGVRSVSGGRGLAGGPRRKVKVWIPRPGAVTWPDGTPAGRYTGTKKYAEVTEEPKRICVYVAGVAEHVCHAKSNVKTAMVDESEVD